MPTASNEQHAKMRLWFGEPEHDCIGTDHAPLEFLKSHGWVLTHDWLWVPPTPAYAASCYEIECIIFLVDEWDFGWIKDGAWLGTRVCLCGEGL